MKFGSLLVLSVFVLFSLNIAVCALGEDAVAIWMFDEGSGDVAADATGNGHDGDINGAQWTNGKFGGALEFNGASDFVEVPNDEALNLTTYTIVATFQIPAGETPDWYTVVCKDTTGPARTYGMWVTPDTGLLNCSFSSDTAWFGLYDPNTDPDIDTRVDDGDWHTVAITYDMEMYRVFVDGELEAEKETVAEPDVADMTLTIGSWHDGGWFGGLIDEIYLAEGALSHADIKRFSSGIAMATPVYSKDKVAVTWGQIKGSR